MPTRSLLAESALGNFGAEPLAAPTSLEPSAPVASGKKARIGVRKRQPVKPACWNDPIGHATVRPSGCARRHRRHCRCALSPARATFRVRNQRRLLSSSMRSRLSTRGRSSLTLHCIGPVRFGFNRKGDCAGVSAVAFSPLVAAPLPNAVQAPESGHIPRSRRRTQPSRARIEVAVQKVPTLDGRLNRGGQTRSAPQRHVTYNPQRPKL